MDKREKVIKGLKCCAIDGGCGACPYDTMKDCPGLSPTPETLMKDALELLKAQLPRVMTWNEVCAWWDIPFMERDPIFHEYRNKRGSVCEWTNLRPCEEESYGMSDRCWTSRPTDEQREAIPWN